METTGNDQTEDRMTKTDAVNYLGLEDACQGLVQRDLDLCIIEFAEDRGFYTGVWDGIPVEYAQAQASGLPGYDNYDGDLDADIARIAVDAVEYLTDKGLLPNGYGHRAPNVTAGYGLDPEDGGGS